MGFTRFNTDVKVHESLSDYPNIDDGMTAEALKTLFDKPGVDLKEALNGLMAELEATSAANSIGVGALYENDESGNTLISKLRYIYNALVEAVMGQIPDNSITQPKLDSSYEATLAKKNGNLQTGLNSEKVGGKTYSQIVADTMNLKKIVDYKVSQDCSTVTISNVTLENDKTYLLLVGVPEDSASSSDEVFQLKLDDTTIFSASDRAGFQYLFLRSCYGNTPNRYCLHIAGSGIKSDIYKKMEDFDFSQSHSFTINVSANYATDILYKGSYLRMYELIGGV